MKSVVKHLLVCTCVLQVWKNKPNPLPTRFVAVSLLVDGQLQPHLAQCPNCGVIHRVQEVGQSAIIPGKSSAAGLLDIAEIKGNLPEKLTDLLEKNGVTQDVWLEVWLLWDNQLWGSTATLAREELSPGVWSGKSLLLIGKTLWKVESWERDDNL